MWQRWLIVTVVVLCAAAGEVTAGETISLTLKSGRSYTAAVDRRSDNETLWLRFERGSTTLLRPIVWSHVVQAQHAGQEIGQAEILGLRSAPSEPAMRAAVPIRESAGSQAESAREALDFQPRVRAVDFDARLANWDRDAEQDGFLLYVYPQSDTGAVVPAAGTLYVTVIAPRKRLFNEVPRGRGKVITPLGRWTRAVSFDQIQDGRPVRLPFQAYDPQLDSRWTATALVQVKYVVPGHGVFAAEHDLVRVRPFSPVRDWQELNTGQRW